MKPFLFFILLSCWAPNVLCAQQENRVLIHAHNDYHQRAPFYQAYAQKVYSIEADVFATQDGRLLVGHDRAELADDRTLERLYITPIVDLFRANGGRAWKGSTERFILLIDLKTPAAVTLDHVVQLVSLYPDVFDEQVNPLAVRVVISGAMPDPASFDRYPHFIFFDGRIGVKYTAKQLERLAFISAPFAAYTRWNGKGEPTTADRTRIAEAINEARQLNKKIRFWGTPDGITSWTTLRDLGVDIINTDKIEECAAYFRNFDNKRFSLSNLPNSTAIAKADRLDQATQGFSGFNLQRLRLSEPVPVYSPTYQPSEHPDSVQNIILLIGDGMGLAQIQAAHTVNKELTMLGIKTLGLQKTNSKDGSTTDSAAAGSALATGEETENRHIAVSSSGEIRRTLTHYAVESGLACGVVTSGNIADATPAAFYGHATDRDNTDRLTEFLLEGKLSLLVGSGKEGLTKRRDGRNLINELAAHYRIADDLHQIGTRSGKVICLDERLDEAVSEPTITLLSEATRTAILKLSNEQPNGFFLMVEGAKIDYAGHANSLPGSVMETLSFDLAVAEALKFADRDRRTLVVVTGDHETGGLTLVAGDPTHGQITALYMTDDHTPLMVPVFAYGPGADEFKGVYRNTQIFHKIKHLLRR